MAMIMIEGYRCDKCGWEWVSRTRDAPLPTMCPTCKTKLWNVRK